MLAVQLSSGDSEHLLNLTKAEFALLKLVDPQSFLKTAILRPPGCKPEVVFPVDRVRQELSRLDKSLSDDRWFHRYAFYTEPEHWGDSGPHVGRIGGFRLPNEAGYAFDLDTGVGYCKLIRIGVDPATGGGRFEEEIDIRDRDLIETDGMGIVRIERKPSCTQFRRKVQELCVWAERLTEPVLLKLVSH